MGQIKYGIIEQELVHLIHYNNNHEKANQKRNNTNEFPKTKKSGNRKLKSSGIQGFVISHVLSEFPNSYMYIFKIQLIHSS